MRSLIMNYGELPDLNGVYLEDSFVLGITERGGSLSFRMDFVLTEAHEHYREPRRNEQYCYATGLLTFEEPDTIEWLDHSDRVFTDASGEQDLGNIDYLIKDHDRWRAGGDWGEVVVHTVWSPSITLDPPVVGGGE